MVSNPERKRHRRYGIRALAAAGLLLLAACASSPKGEIYQQGKASWYGAELQGRKTASGEPFDMHKLTAAHRSLPFGTMVCVRSRVSKRDVLVRINDRGPFSGGRIIDLSKEAASRLGILKSGEEAVDLFTSRCP